jgi:hypothetical protein
VEGRDPVHMGSPIAEKMYFAKFYQRPLDLIIPLVPPFEREVFKAPDCFLLRHRSTDHRGRKIECEVLRAAFPEEINRSVDKGRGPRTALPWHPLSKSAAGSRRGRRRSTSQDFISVRPTIPTSSPSASTMLIGGTGQDRTEADHRALLGEAGFSLTRVIPTAGPLSISKSRQVLESQIIAG